MASAGLRAHYPWLTTNPVIINAPMAGFAGPDLAIAVHESRGFGFIGATNDVESLRSALEEISLTIFDEPLPPQGEVLPIGIGILVFYQDAKAEEILRVVSEFRPAAVWLFAAHTGSDYESWSRRVREASSNTKIWVQVSSVAAAIEAARNCQADVLVLQGSDAGGHGKMPGASIISLLPETTDMLKKEGLGHVILVAAGGIADGRGVAAALAAGAKAVVMGTAFLAAKEVEIHAAYRDAVLESNDGGVSTIRSTIFDELPGKNIWPQGYDGRAIVAQSYTDHLGGMSVDDLRKRYKEAKVEETQGFGPDNRRAAVWAGTGVGLVQEVRPANLIMAEVRWEAKRTLKEAIARLYD